MSLLTETVLLRTRGQVTHDRYGRETREPDHDVTWRAWYEPRQSSENVAAKEQYVEGYWLYLPLDAPMDWDAVVLGAGGPEFEVVGKPGRQPSGFVVEGFWSMAVERVTG